jgi:ribosomal protein S18 acetylase RimI-like enzyme
VSPAPLRPATVDDVPALARLAATAFGSSATGWTDRLRRFVRLRYQRTIESDPDGAFIAEDEGGPAGMAVALKREGIWVLSSLGVHPDAQGQGLGRRLFDAALAYGDDCRGFLIGASERKEALALYSRAGFRVHPAMVATGTVRHAAVPDLPDVREGTSADLEGHCAEVDRAIRGGARTGDLATLVEMGFRLYVTPRGYAFGADDGLRVLAARDEADAAQLLWAVLRATTGEATIPWLDGRQGWAFDVVVAAGLGLAPQGPYLSRGDLGPLWPFLPHGALL